MIKIDLLQSKDTHDLGDPATAGFWMEQEGPHDFLLVTPPGCSFSHAVWANSLGPGPVRSAHYPEGFPWLSAKGQAKAVRRNTLVGFTWKVLGRVRETDQEHLCIGFSKHPEDLGQIPRGREGGIPASIWRSRECNALRKAGW